MQSAPAGDGTPGRASQSRDNGATAYAGSVKKAARSRSPHTRRTYRCDVLSFVEFMRIRWPEQAEELLRASVAAVRHWRHAMRSNAMN